MADGRRDRADAEVVEQFSERRRAQGAGRAARGGSAARAHDAAEAERLAKAGQEALELPAKSGEPTGRGQWLEEKSVLATLIRRRTGARNARVADRLGISTKGNVTRAVRRVRTERQPGRRLKELERMLENGTLSRS